MFNIESLHEILRSTIPPITASEYKYFEEFQLFKLYEDSSLKNFSYVPNSSEPEILFYEFMFILG
jgi:hypothetical protein